MMKGIVLSAALLMAGSAPAFACDQTGQTQTDALLCKITVLAQEIGRLESEKLDTTVELRLTQAAIAGYEARLSTAMEWLKAAQAGQKP